MVGNNTFLIGSFCYSLLMTILYFSKPRMNGYENRIYKRIIYANIFSSLFAVISYYSIDYFGESNILGLFLSKGFLILNFLWVFLLTRYIYVLTHPIKDMDDYEVAYKKRRNIVSIICLVVMLIILISPLNIYNKSKVIYTFGIAQKVTNGAIGISCLLWIYYFFRKIDLIPWKKMLPFIIFLIIWPIITIVQIFYPELLVLSFLQGFVTLVLYFTIENPDIEIIKQLNVAKAQAEVANSAKTDFLSSMSQEIRTPLNAIVGFSQALLEEKISDECKDEVKDIVSASETLIELVNGILDISKIEADKLEIIDKEYSFKLMFYDLVSLTKARLGDKKLDFTYFYDNDIPPVLFGDSVRLKQIILNLLTNAIKYTPEGFVRFEVKSFIRDDVCKMIISVEDSGKGIKQENIDRLFSKFDRLEEENSAIEGTGLGLAITKKLVNLMGGQVIVQSVYGKGSKFIIFMDQKITNKKNSEVAENNSNNDSIDFSNKKILLVDDNNLNIKVAVRLLEKYNLKIDSCLSGEECLKMVKDKKYDLILTDDMMPKMSGKETLLELRKMEGFDTPVVVLTANAISGMREEYMNFGFDEYLSKPIDKKDLNRVLNIFLGK